MRLSRKFVIVGVLAMIGLGCYELTYQVPRAGAIPAFARKYDFACNVCHVPSFPKLNDFGNLFRDHSSISRIPQGPTEETCKPTIFAALCSGESLFSRPMSWFHEKNTSLFIAGGSPPATNLFVANQALQLLTM